MVTSVATAAPDLIRTNAFVDGRWVGADGGETFPVVNPATGETIVEVPRLGAPETRRAIEAAERALPAWKALTAKERARILTRLATLMASRVTRIRRSIEGDGMTAPSTRFACSANHS